MRIACVVVPRFPLAVELLDRPELGHRPVVLGGAPEERRLVVECSPRAEQAGIRRGMSLRDALARCRDAAFLEAHPARYADVFGRMLDALEQISPIVEGAHSGCAFVDLAGLPGAGTPDGEKALGEALTRAVKAVVGLTPRAGIADGRFAAWVAAASPGRSRIVATGRAAAFLAALPVQRLPLSDEMLRRLHWLGVQTAGELAALPRGALAAQFGPEGALAWDLARGKGGRPLVPRRHPPELSAHLTFPRPVVEAPAVLAAARLLLGRLLARPECAGRAVRGVTLRAALGNRHHWQRDLTFREPTGNCERMLRALAARLDSAVFPAAVEALELRLHELCGETGVQPSLFSARTRLLQGLDGALEQLHARFGQPLVMKIVGVEPWSRIPERQYALIPVGSGQVDYDHSTSLSP